MVQGSAVLTDSGGTSAAALFADAAVVCSAEGLRKHTCDCFSRSCAEGSAVLEDLGSAFAVALSADAKGYDGRI
eukprot:1150267-Pelagomonas_calceolata.AAC.4